MYEYVIYLYVQYVFLCVSATKCVNCMATFMVSKCLKILYHILFGITMQF